MMTADDLARRPTCPWCQAAIPSAARYCPVCGHVLAGQPEPPVDAAAGAGIDLRLERIERQLAALDRRLSGLEHAATPPAVVAREHRPPAPVLPAAPPRPAPVTPAPVALPARPWPAAPPPPTVVEPARRRTLVHRPGADLEDLLSGRGLAWLGGLALVIGAVFFLSLAFSRGWIGPAERVTIGLVAGALMLAGGGWFVRGRLVRALLAASGVALVTYVLPFELSGPGLVGGWSATWVAALLLWREPAFRPEERAIPGGWRSLPAVWAPRALAVAAGVVATCAVVHLTTLDLPSEEAFDRALPDTPFTDGPSLAAAFMIVAALAGAWVVRAWERARGWSIVAAAAIAAYLLVFQVQPAAVVAGWAALAVAVVLLSRWDVANTRLYDWASLTLLGSGAMLTLSQVAPPERLAVDAASTIDHPLLWSGATVAGVALAAAAVVVARAMRGERAGRWLIVASAVAVAWTLSVGLVDEFQRQVGGATALEELQKQAQVGLSILWATLGVAAFVAGIALRSGEWRWLGLGLLGVAAAKVFVVDLASLDAAYRVLSFVGLGILLLLSSWAYQHWMPHLPGSDGRHGPAAGAG